MNFMENHINVEVDTATVLKTVDDYVLHNNPDIKELFKEILSKNDTLLKLYTKLLLGEKLPIKPKVDQMGRYSFKNWFSNRQYTQNTELDKKGYLDCKVIAVNGYGDWGQLSLEAPTYNETGEIIITQLSAKFEDFIWLEDDIMDLKRVSEYTT
jgi:hypothetical protein